MGVVTPASCSPNGRSTTASGYFRAGPVVMLVIAVIVVALGTYLSHRFVASRQAHHVAGREQ